MSNPLLVFLILAAASVLSGCASIAAGLLYPLTEHGQCVRSCESKYSSPEQQQLLQNCLGNCRGASGAEELQKALEGKVEASRSR